MASTTASWGEDEIRLTDAVSVLRGAELGKYPSGNSLVIRGAAETMIIDPSVTVVERGGASVPVDVVVNSHAHEDHVAGNGVFPEARVHAHHDDLAGVQTIDGLLNSFGYDDGPEREEARELFITEFHFAARPDATGFGDGHVFDLGGQSVSAMHLPGHTAGHSGFLIDGGVFYLSDIDLTGFGPYYGDAVSSLDQFEESIAIAREVDAAFYVTFHHKGIIEGRETFLDMIDAFGAVIGRRHDRMLEYLAEPRTIDEMAAHRFVYRAHVESVYAQLVEHRTAQLHVDRMLARGEAAEVEPGRFQAS